MERSRLLASGTVLAIESLPPSWAAKISSALSAATGASAAPSGEVGLAGVIVSMDTSLSPGAHRGRTALGCWGTVVPEMGWGKLRGAPGWRACGEAPGSAGAGAAPVLPW